MQSKSRRSTPSRTVVTVLFFALELSGITMLSTGHTPLALGLGGAALGLITIALLARW
jgi:hypothetical protein